MSDIDCKVIPVLGGLLLEAVEADVSTHIAEKRGLKRDSDLAKLGFTIEYAEATSREEAAVTGRQWKARHGNVPVQKGKIIRMSMDAYGEAFKSKYGRDTEVAHINDVVMFIPGQAFKVDIDGKFLIIKDEDVMAIERS